MNFLILIKEIAKYIIKGYSNSEIAKMLFVSKSTVKVHVSNILQKTKAKNRVNLAYILGSIEI